jgi:hypothetical protein
MAVDSPNDSEDRPVNDSSAGGTALPTGPCPSGTPGRPGGGSDVSGNTSNQPRFVIPAGTSTNNQPRPEDFM